MTKSEMNSVLWIALQGLIWFPEVIAQKLDMTQEEIEGTQQLVLRELVFQGEEE